MVVEEAKEMDGGGGPGRGCGEGGRGVEGVMGMMVLGAIEEVEEVEAIMVELVVEVKVNGMLEVVKVEVEMADAEAVEVERVEEMLLELVVTLIFCFSPSSFSSSLKRGFI